MCRTARKLLQLALFLHILHCGTEAKWKVLIINDVPPEIGMMVEKTHQWPRHWCYSEVVRFCPAFLSLFIDICFLLFLFCCYFLFFILRDFPKWGSCALFRNRASKICFSGWFTWWILCPVCHSFYLSQFVLSTVLIFPEFVCSKQNSTDFWKKCLYYANWSGAKESAECTCCRKADTVAVLSSIN